jgi:acid phosphatase type 7
LGPSYNACTSGGDALRVNPSDPSNAVVARGLALRGAAVVLLAALSVTCGGSPAPSPLQPSAVAPQTLTGTEGPEAGTNEPPVTTPTLPVPPDPPPGSGTATLSAVGDIGWCGSPGVSQTAALLDRFRDPILLLGDIAYPNGTLAEFRRCFDPEYGRFRSRFRPGPGNHEYDYAGADGYFTYFGDAAGAGRTGYYAFRAASWQVLMLNSAVPIDRGSAQFAWVREQLRDRARCTLATVHHPFDSSGSHGQTPFLADVWQLLYENGADVVLNGHDHDYERIAPVDGSRGLDRDRGIRQFTVGTGGAPLYPKSRRAAHSEVFIEAWGILRLTLAPTLYEWEFLGVNGTTLDRGAATCH